MHATFLLSILSLLVTSSSQINIAFSNPLSRFDYIHQSCSDIALHICCVPMDILVPDLGRGWFRAEPIAFTYIPMKPMSASVWKYKKDSANRLPWYYGWRFENGG